MLPNNNKSRVFIAGVSEPKKIRLCSLMGFQLGSLPVRYLGVPLISTKLSASDCAPLISKFYAKIDHWSTRSLSYAGRLQLITSVLFSLQVFWSMHFILPKVLGKHIELLLRKFLWSGSNKYNHSQKVAWESLCCPKNEGGSWH